MKELMQIIFVAAVLAGAAFACAVVAGVGMSFAFDDVQPAAMVQPVQVSPISPDTIEYAKDVASLNVTQSEANKNNGFANLANDTGAAAQTAAAGYAIGEIGAVMVGLLVVAAFFAIVIMVGRAAIA